MLPLTTEMSILSDFWRSSKVKSAVLVIHEMN